MSGRADPRGPFRTVASVAFDNPNWVATLVECGHESRHNATQAAPKVGELVRCFACGPQSVAVGAGGAGRAQRA